jgi:hypothetical protein
MESHLKTVLRTTICVSFLVLTVLPAPAFAESPKCLGGLDGLIAKLKKQFAEDDARHAADDAERAAKAKLQTTQPASSSLNRIDPDATIQMSREQFAQLPGGQSPLPSTRTAKDGMNELTQNTVPIASVVKEVKDPLASAQTASAQLVSKDRAASLQPARLDGSSQLGNTQLGGGAQLGGAPTNSAVTKPATVKVAAIEKPAAIPPSEVPKISEPIAVKPEIPKTIDQAYADKKFKDFKTSKDPLVLTIEADEVKRRLQYSKNMSDMDTAVYKKRAEVLEIALHDKAKANPFQVSREDRILLEDLTRGRMTGWRDLKDLSNDELKSIQHQVPWNESDLTKKKISNDATNELRGRDSFKAEQKAEGEAYVAKVNATKATKEAEMRASSGFQAARVTEAERSHGEDLMRAMKDNPQDLTYAQVEQIHQMRKSFIAKDAVKKTEGQGINQVHVQGMNPADSAFAKQFEAVYARAHEVNKNAASASIDSLASKQGRVTNNIAHFTKYEFDPTTGGSTGHTVADSRSAYRAQQQGRPASGTHIATVFAENDKSFKDASTKLASSGVTPSELKGVNAASAVDPSNLSEARITVDQLKAFRAKFGENPQKALADLDVHTRNQMLQLIDVADFHIKNHVTTRLDR